MIVVSRWYGGIMLGPLRFRHMEQVALDALQAGRFINNCPRSHGVSTVDCSIVNNNTITATGAASINHNTSETAASAESNSVSLNSSSSPEIVRLARILRARHASLTALQQKLELLLAEERATVVATAISADTTDQYNKNKDIHGENVTQHEINVLMCFHRRLLEQVHAPPEWVMMGQTPTTSTTPTAITIGTPLLLTNLIRERDSLISELKQAISATRSRCRSLQ